MTDEAHDAALAAEFEALARRAGIDVLEDRRAAMLECYRDYRKMLARLHGQREAYVESANVFTIETIGRGAE
ncbi:MAG: hypothetical protein AB7F96_16095 [Beijerinckiaceae bacterium]